MKCHSANAGRYYFSFLQASYKNIYNKKIQGTASAGAAS